MKVLVESKANNHLVTYLLFITKVAVMPLNKFLYHCYCGSYKKCEASRCNTQGNATSPYSLLMEMLGMQKKEVLDRFLFCGLQDTSFSHEAPRAILCQGNGRNQ